MNEPAYQQRAVEYACNLLDDPVQGFYRGEDKTAHGLVWYWTDAGSYTGFYSMRMPFHFHRLYQINPDSRFLDICDVIGRTLLRQQTGAGLVHAGWSSANGWKESGVRLGSRLVYALATFATLYRITKDDSYFRGYEKGVEALLKMQNPDGSFFQYYETDTALPNDASIKLHFFSYIFHAILEAFAVTHDPRLLECGRRMAITWPAFFITATRCPIAWERDCRQRTKPRRIRACRIRAVVYFKWPS